MFLETKRDQVRWKEVLMSHDQLKTVSAGPTVAVSITQ
jgi:hypothetical protein